MSYKTHYNRGRRGPTRPTVVTSFAVGNPVGQIPSVHVRDITNGFDLYTLNADVVSQYPASTTKLMTLLLTWEHKSTVWTNTVTVTTADVTQPAGLTLSFAGLQAGDILSWEDLAYCMALPSGGDACQCAARIIGDDAYTAAGNTGTQGMPRFVEMMNARAAQLNMTGAVYTDPAGASKTGVTVRNVMPARSLSIVATAALTIPGIRTVAGATARNVTITGANARTLALTNAIIFLNGPFTTPAGFKDSSIMAAKGGAWSDAGFNVFNMSLIYRSPAGYEVVVTTIGCETYYSNMLDMRGLIYQLLKDFPYLSQAANADPSFSNVKLLIGGDGSIADESSAARVLTNTSVTVGTPVIGLGSGSMLVNNVNDALTAPDGSDTVLGTGDAVFELWYSGNGTAPADGVEYVFAGKAASNNLEFAVNYFNGGFNIFVSTNGSSWNNTAAYVHATATDKQTFFNGAPRHIAFVKHGTVWTLYVNGDAQSGTLTVGTPFNGTAPINVVSAGAAAIGRLDEFRATYGTARYTDAMVSLIARKFPRS